MECITMAVATLSLSTLALTAGFIYACLNSKCDDGAAIGQALMLVVMLVVVVCALVATAIF